MKKNPALWQKPYSKPIISTGNPSDWYIFFSFNHNGNLHKFKHRKGINRYQDLKERKKEAEALRDATEAKLQLGWNPVVDPGFKARNVLKTEAYSEMNFCEAIDFALQKKKPDIAKKTFQDYKNVLEIIKEKAIELGFSLIQIRSFTRLHMLELLTRLFEDRKMSNHRFNIFLGVIRSMFSTLESWTICEYNPASKIANKPIAESNFYESYSQEEKELISKKLCKEHFQLFVFMLFVYYTGIRPKELLRLKVNCVDLQKKLITIIPNLEEENSKTKFIRHVAIPNALCPFIEEIDIKKIPGEFYLFGSPFKPGQGNRGGGSNQGGISGAMRKDFLTPSANKASRDTVGRLWKKLIKDKKTGLGINKCLYAAKHTGADDKILAGISIDSLRNQYGHRSKQMTEHYTKKISEIYQSEIRSNSPQFTGGKFLKIA